VRRHGPAAGFALTLLVPLLVVATGSATAAPSTGAVSTTTSPASSVLDRGAAARGHWFVRSGTTGDLLVWRSPSRLPVTDDRPEFRVGTRVVGLPRVSRNGRSLSLPVASMPGVDPSAVEVWVGLHRLDSTARSLPPSRTATTTQSSGIVPGPDPGVPGTYAVTSFDYTAADLPWPGFKAPMEVLGHAVLPVGVQHAPLVLFLHGRHIACYGKHDHGFWPCASTSRPVPSYKGYVYLQRLLASQGYATVSISANAINAQDGVTNDGGAGARSALVRHHLDLLAQWSADAADARWSGRLDLNRVVLIGHSRGGEGVDQAAIDTRRSAPYHLSGQILLAPTDFGYQTAPYLPTELLMGYCDGDVSDLQGQRYVDAEPLLAGDDPTLRSSVLLLGANHNFFNTEWTPGLSRAPSEDDWWDASDPVCGADASATRLTAAEQRRAAMTFVAAGVHAFLGNDTASALGYLDSDAPVAVPDAGPAVALTHALGGRRRTVRIGDGATVAGGARACRAGQPAGDPNQGRSTVATRRLPLCGLPDYYRQPHWTPAAPFPASVHAAYGRTLPHQVSFSWDQPGDRGGLALARPLYLAGTQRRLDLRVVVDPSSGPVRLQVMLGSGGTLQAGPVVTLSPLPGSTYLSALWAQTIRIDPADYPGGVDLSTVDRVLLRAVSGSGRVWLLDASLRLPGLAPVPDRSLPVVSVGRVVRVEGGPHSSGLALLPFRVTGTVQHRAQFAIAADQSTWSETKRPQFATVTVVPGQRTGTIAIRYEADRVDDVPSQIQLVHTVPVHGLVTSGFVGIVDVRDDDAAPRVILRPARRTAHYGDDLVFRLHLSAPVDYYVVNVVRALCVDRYRPLRTSDVPRRWLRAQVGSAPHDVPLCRVWRQGFLELPPGSTRSKIVVPTLRHPLHNRAKALTVRFSAHYLTSPLRATIRVLPSG
jgi:hypothetical protein